MIPAYPLQWPAGWKRTQPGDHKQGRFSTRRARPGTNYIERHEVSVAEAAMRVVAELEQMGLGREDVVISTNVRVRLDGLPRSGEREPEDSGAAVYWESGTGAHRVMAIDRYVKVADNLAAIAATLDAMRAIERHGGATILDRAFTGFSALPAPGAPKTWDVVLGVPPHASTEAVTAAYRSLRSTHHPDRPGGSHDRMAEINAAWEQFRKLRGL